MTRGYTRLSVINRIHSARMNTGTTVTPHPQWSRDAAYYPDATELGPSTANTAASTDERIGANSIGDSY
jgi:hypothetical protein